MSVLNQLPLDSAIAAAPVVNVRLIAVAAVPLAPLPYVNVLVLAISATVKPPGPV